MKLRAAAVGKWKYVSLACSAVIAFKFLTVFGFGDHPHHETNQNMEYTHIRTSKFPWGDGEESLFGVPKKHH